MACFRLVRYVSIPCTSNGVKYYQCRKSLGINSSFSMISSFLPKFLFGRDRNPNKALRRAPRGFDEKQRDRPTEEGRNVCPKEDSLKGDFTRVVLENVEWGMQAFDVAKELLSRTRDIELYSFRAFKSNKVDIRLDKISDTYGSPTLHEIGAFSQQYCALLENSIGEEQIGLLEIEVSSPGAERSVRVPSELERFRGLPMSVRTKDDQTGSKVYEFIAMDDGLTKWRYADVKANRSLGKGKGLTRRQKETIFEIPVDSLDSVNLHIDL